MNKWKKYGAIIAVSLCLAVPAVTVTETAVITAEAHSGRTDGNGGHRDNKNKSGLGSYHYHCGGYGPHLHENGVCPYKTSYTGTQSSQPKAETAAETAALPAVTEDLKDAYKAVFDAEYYYNANPDLQTSVGSDSMKLFEHFYHSGMAEGRRGCEAFDVNVYREKNKDLAELFGEDLKQYYDHYIHTGCGEDRVCH